jgi:thiopeptide-type bacteriocin biosynthesis protein
MEGMIQRNFILGESWLYYKIYSAPRTSDIFIAEVLKPLTDELMEQNIIDQWFFIRYADPNHHLRVRFQFSDLNNIGVVIARLQPFLTQFLDDFLIWEVQTDTYKREVERYGENTMHLSETLFYNDSKMIVDFLHSIYEVEDDQIRWLFSLKAIDAFLDSFLMDDTEKLSLLTPLQDSFRAEFNVTKLLAKQVNDKFRAERQHINNIMSLELHGNHSYAPFFQFLIRKQEMDTPVAAQILSLHKQGKLQVPLQSLLASYVHMLMNRLFKSKNRLHEMVCYDFLYRYYKSKIAKMKYSSQKK